MAGPGQAGVRATVPKQPSKSSLLSSSSPSSSTPSSKPCESPTAKVWKARLKEYFDKHDNYKGKEVKIRYSAKESSKGGRLQFTAIVYCPEIGYAEGGEDCSSKSAAEHNAAYHALKMLEAS